MALALELTRLAEEAKQAAIAKELEQAATKRAEELAKANDVLRHSIAQLTSITEIRGLVRELLKEAMVQSGANSATVFLKDKAGLSLQMRELVLAGEVVEVESDPRVAIFRHGLDLSTPQSSEGWQRMTTGERVMWIDWDDPVHKSEVQVWHREQGHISIGHLPLMQGEEAIGFLGLGFTTPNRPSPEKLEMARALAQQVTLALELQRLAEDAKQAVIAKEQEKAAQERADELAKANNALKRNLDSLATQPELEAFLQSVVNEAAAQTRAESVCLFLYDEHTDSLSLSVASDNGGDWRSVADMELWKRPFPAHCTPAWETVTSSRIPIVLSLEPKNPLLWDGTLAWHQQRGHTRAVMATLWLGEQSLGFLGLALTEGVTFTPEELELIQALTQQATLAIELTRLAEQSRHTAILEERNRMAREIHDTLAQALTSIIVRLQTASLILEAQEEVRNCIDAARELVDFSGNRATI